MLLLRAQQPSSRSGDGSFRDDYNTTVFSVLTILSGREVVEGSGMVEVVQAIIYHNSALSHTCKDGRLVIRGFEKSRKKNRPQE